MVKHQVTTVPIQVFPTPQESYLAGKALALGPVSGYHLTFETAGAMKANPVFAEEFQKRMQQRFNAQAGAAAASVKVVMTLDPRALPARAEHVARHLGTLEDREGYVLSTASKDAQNYVLIAGKSEAALWRAFASLVQLVEEKDGQLRIPGVELIDYPQMKQRGLLVDLGGQGFMVGQARWEFGQWKQFVDWMVDQKFNEIWLEFIGSGRLMGNLDPEKGEWIGFSLALKSYPDLVARDRPIKRWDEAQQRVVADKFTSPNVRQEFVRELIDYAQARGIKCVLLIGYDYFANMLPYTLGVPANDPSHRGANKIYDKILQEIVERYSNAQGVAFITIENKSVPPSMVDEVARRAREGSAIVHAINPKMDIGILNDYLEWRPREEFERYAEIMPKHVYQLFSPHTQPQNKSWKRIYGDVYRYELFTQYAWNHTAYVFPERVREEVQESYINGYRKILTQAWYADVFLLNYATFAEMSWNSTGTPLDEFWDATLERYFGAAAKDDMKVALEHTRFDRRLDIVSRMVLGNHIDKPFRFWDMYTLTNFPGLTEEMLTELQVDAEASLQSARAAAPKVSLPIGREMLDVVITSAERRFYLATSARAWVKAMRALKAGDTATAEAARQECFREADKLTRAAVKLGIEYPTATHDDEVVAHYRKTLETSSGKK